MHEKEKNDFFEDKCDSSVFGIKEEWEICSHCKWEDLVKDTEEPCCYCKWYDIQDPIPEGFDYEKLKKQKIK